MGYLIRRLLSLGAILLSASVFMFFLTHILPGDPARVALGDGATPEMIARYRRDLGLDQPVWTQYRIQMAKLLQGDWGRSIYTNRPVVEDLAQFFPATLELTIFSMVFSCVVGVFLGALGAVNRGTYRDYLSQVFSLLLVSAPVFWLGLVSQFALSHKLRWLPLGFRLDPNLSPPPPFTGLLTIDALLTGQWSTFLNAFQHLILPGIVLSSLTLASIARMTRASILDVITEPYVNTARAKGLSNHRILRVHILKNAAIPVVTLLGIRFGQLLGGAVVTESIFQWPGIGKYAFDAISRFDFPALMGSFLIAVLLYGLINLFVDALYFWFDPRLREAS